MDRTFQPVVVTLLVSIMSLFASSACRRSNPEETVTPQEHEAAASAYLEHCAPCHGAGGRGDGPKAAELSEKPRDFSNIVWHLAVSDGHIDKVIREGGPAVGKSQAMKASPAVAGEPRLVLALRQYVRELAKRPQ